MLRGTFVNIPFIGKVDSECQPPNEKQPQVPEDSTNVQDKPAVQEPVVEVKSEKETEAATVQDIPSPEAATTNVRMPV